MEFSSLPTTHCYRFMAFAHDRSWNTTRFVMAWRALSDHRTLPAAQEECERYARALEKFKGR
jgi:hypothetical protein